VAAEQLVRDPENYAGAAFNQAMSEKVGWRSTCVSSWLW